MNWLLIIILIIAGIIALMLEFLALPGAIVGILGALSILGGVVLAYTQYGVMAGNITLFSTAIVVVIVIVLFLRSNTWKKLALDTQIDSKVNDHATDLEEGMEGKTVSRLAPAGKAIFTGEAVEVFSSHEFIDENSKIIISKIEGNKIIVKLKK